MSFASSAAASTAAQVVERFMRCMSNGIVLCHMARTTSVRVCSERKRKAPSAAGGGGGGGGGGSHDDEDPSSSGDEEDG